jgi:hypothetical protein
LVQRTLDSGVVNLGNGWYASTFTPDVAGRHTIKLEVTAIGGLQERVKEDVVVNSY